MKKYIVSILVLISAIAFLVPADAEVIAEYRLEDVLWLAAERAERIRLSEEDIHLAEAARDKALAALAPRLSLFGEGRRYSESERSGAQIVQPETMTVWGARLEQTFSLGGRELSALRATRENILRSGYDYDAVREGYLFGVASSYYSLLRAKKSLGIAASNVERLRKHRDAAESRLKAGEATKTALLRAEAELSGAEAQRINAENRLSLAKAELARAAAIEGEFDIRETPGEDASTLGAEGDMNLLKEEALVKRPEVRSAGRRVAVAREQVKFASGAYLPAFSVEGVYSNREDDPKSLSAVSESIYAGIRLSFTVFDGGLRAADVKDARSRLRQTELSLDDAKRAVTLDVEFAYLDLITRRGILKSLADQLAFARDNYDAVSRQFDFGLATSTDVMDANNLLVSAENQYSEAVYLRELAELGLRRATGTFIEKTLEKLGGKAYKPIGKDKQR